MTDPTAFDLAHEQQGDVDLLSLRGRHGSLRIAGPEDAEAIGTGLKTALGTSYGLKVVLDLAAVELMASAMLAELLALRQGLQERGGALVLAGLRGPVRELFTLTKLDRVFTLAGSPAEGLERIAQTRQPPTASPRNAGE